MSEKISRGKPFPTLLSEEVMIAAGFNGWEPSWLLRRNRHRNPVYLGHVDGINLVVIAQTKISPMGRHREWYFGTFPGPKLADRPIDAQEDFIRSVEKILYYRNRVAGRKLEGLIRQSIGY